MAVAGVVVEALDVGPRMRRLVVDVPTLDDLGLTGAPDEAVALHPCAEGTTEGRPGANYTIGGIDVRARRLSCDVLLHHRGPMSAWAAGAPVGDRVILDCPRRWYRPEPATDWQLLVADLTGLPALARILQHLPHGTGATAVVEVLDSADLDYLPTRPDVCVIACMGSGNGHTPSRLANLMRERVLPDGRGYCWFSGEATTARHIRKQLRNQCRWDPAQCDVVGYWRHDAETWNDEYQHVSAHVEAVYEQALAHGMDDKLAAEEYDIALERAGL